MEGGITNVDLLENIENDESSSVVRTELADEGMIDPNSTSKICKVVKTDNFLQRIRIEAISIVKLHIAHSDLKI